MQGQVDDEFECRRPREAGTDPPDLGRSEDRDLDLEAGDVPESFAGHGRDQGHRDPDRRECTCPAIGPVDIT
jgi:hypothetical protein